MSGGEKGRQRLSREDRRLQLLAVAKEVLLEHGYTDMTMERIASAADVSKTLIYHHFPNRRAVFLALLSEEQMRMLMQISPAMGVGDTEEKVKRGIASFLEAVTERGPKGYTAFYRDPIGHDPTIALEIDRYREQVAEMVAAMFAEDVGVPPETLILQAHAVVGAINNAVVWMSQNDVDMNDPEVAESLTTLIWDGLKSVRENALVDAKKSTKAK